MKKISNILSTLFIASGFLLVACNAPKYYMYQFNSSPSQGTASTQTTIPNEAVLPLQSAQSEVITASNSVKTEILETNNFKNINLKKGNTNTQTQTANSVNQTKADKIQKLLESPLVKKEIKKQQRRSNGPSALQLVLIGLLFLVIGAICFWIPGLGIIGIICSIIGAVLVIWGLLKFLEVV